MRGGASSGISGGNNGASSGRGGISGGNNGASSGRGGISGGNNGASSNHRGMRGRGGMIAGSHSPSRGRGMRGRGGMIAGSNSPSRGRGGGLFPKQDPTFNAWTVPRNHAPQQAPQAAHQPAQHPVPAQQPAQHPVPAQQPAQHPVQAPRINAWTVPRNHAQQQAPQPASLSASNIRRHVQSTRPRTRREQPQIQYKQPDVLIQRPPRQPVSEVGVPDVGDNFYTVLIKECFENIDWSEDEDDNQEAADDSEEPADDTDVRRTWNGYFLDVLFSSYVDEDIANRCLDFFQGPERLERDQLKNTINNIITVRNKRFDPDKDSFGMLAICLVFDVKITFITGSDDNTASDKIVYHTDNENNTLFCQYRVDAHTQTEVLEVADTFLLVGQQQFSGHLWDCTPDCDMPWVAWVNNQTRHEEKVESTAAQYFLASKEAYYKRELQKQLQLAYTHWQTTQNPVEVYKRVYEAYKEIFGKMLGECRQYFETGPKFSRKDSWMRHQLHTENGKVTKTQWRNVLNESIALWHAVVVAFREVYKTTEGGYLRIELFEPPADRNGNTHPVHHVSNLVIKVNLSNDPQARPVVVSRAWSTYTKKLFAKNTEKFVQAYQGLLMAHYDMGNDDVAVFGFWFYLSDLARWIRDIRELIANPTYRMRGYENKKRFEWPRCCRKGEPLDDNPTTSLPYKEFCRKMHLSFHDKRSQQQFRMRMRAAWLRLVSCYPYSSTRTLEDADINRHLQDQHIREVDVATNAVEQPTDLTHIEDFFDKTTDDERTQLRNRRVLVPGAHMSNPYICSPMY